MSHNDALDSNGHNKGSYILFFALLSEDILCEKGHQDEHTTLALLKHNKVYAKEERI